MDFFGIGPMEIILILIIGLLIFGPRKLPQIGRDLGKAFRSFKKAATDISVEMSKELEGEKEALSSFKKAATDISAEMSKELEGEKKAFSSFKKAATDISAEMSKELDEIKEAKEPNSKQTETQKSEANMLSKPEAGENVR